MRDPTGAGDPIPVPCSLLEQCIIAKNLLDLITKEQLLNMLLEDVQVWVVQQKPKTTSEAGELTNDHL